MMNKWETFGRWCMEQLRDEIGNDLDGGAAQDKAEELGLLVRIHVTESCGDHCSCAEYDDFPQECLRAAPEEKYGDDPKRIAPFLFYFTERIGR